MDDNGNLLTTAGLVPRIQWYLKATGIRTRLADRTRWRFLEDRYLDLYDAPGITVLDRQCLEAVGTNPRGVLVVRPSELTRYLSLICDLFPTARIIMVAATNEQKFEIKAKLEKFMGVTVETDDTLMWGMPRKLFVCTANIFDCANPRDWDIVIFTDWQSAVAKRPRENAVRFMKRDILIYAFLAPHQVLAERDQLWLEATCGPVIFRSPDLRGVLAGVLVEWIGVPPLALPRGTTVFEHKRALWHHAERNRQIAHVAGTVRMHRRKLLGAAGLTSLPRRGHRWNSASVLVESREQAEALANYLPDWPILDCSSAATHLDYGIVTMRYASDWKLTCDVLLRADGGRGWPLHGQFPCRGAAERQVLIDFDDNGDKAARQTTASRYEAYKREGWAQSSGALCTGH
jgi:hypothetical protein